MLHIGLCDDQLPARQNLLGMLRRRLAQRELDAEFWEFSSGEGVLGWLEKHPGGLDVLFLDIEMGGISGMETARRIRQEDGAILLVFVTGYADYVFDGYSVNALDYLMKPVDMEKLDGLLLRILGATEKAAPRLYCVKNAEGIFKVPLADILYFQSEGRKVQLHTAGRCHAFYARLNDVETQLPGGFVRIHQRYLVRAAAVDSFEGDRVMVAGRSLPVSRACRAGAMLAITEDRLGEGTF